MRKTATCFASFLLTASLCVAAGYYRELLALPRVAVGAAVDPTLLFNWNCETNDVRLGVPVGYSVGTNIGTKAFAVFSTDRVYNGTFSLYNNADGGNHSFAWSTNASPIINVNTGTLDLWIYVGGPTYGTPIRLTSGDANNKLMLWLTGGNAKVRLQHIAGGTSRDAYSTGGVTSNAWNHIKARWSATSVGGYYSKITVNTTDGESNQDTSTGQSALGSWSTTNSGFLQFGDTEYNGMRIYIDAIYIYNTWK
jgi:hypothetical protein